MARSWRCVALVLCFSAVASAQDIVLVREGKAEAAIVLAKGATAAEERGARELRDHLKEMSGAELGAEVPAGGVEVRIAYDASLGPEEYRLKTEGRRLSITGGRPRGVLYGCTALLDRLGVRWFTPDGDRRAEARDRVAAAAGRARRAGVREPARHDDGGRRPGLGGAQPAERRLQEARPLVRRLAADPSLRPLARRDRARRARREAPGVLPDDRREALRRHGCQAHVGRRAALPDEPGGGEARGGEGAGVDPRGPRRGGDLGVAERRRRVVRVSVVPQGRRQATARGRGCSSPS